MLCIGSEIFVNLPVFFEAFAVTGFSLDLGFDQTISSAVFHNLKMASNGNVTIRGRAEAQDEMTDLGNFAVKRFMTMELAAPQTVRYLEFTFDDNLVDLQEVSLF